VKHYCSSTNSPKLSMLNECTDGLSRHTGTGFHIQSLLSILATQSQFTVLVPI